MPHIDMIDTYEDYALVYNRPAGLSVNAAIRRYMGIHDGYEIHLARARYYYHTRTPYFYNWLNDENVQRPTTPAAPVVEQKDSNKMKIKPSMCRYFDEHVLVLMRPKGFSIAEALVLYGLAPEGDAQALQAADGIYRRWLGHWSDYHCTNPRGLRDLVRTGQFVIPTEEGQTPIAFDEDHQYPLDIEIDLEESEDDCMKVGDIVVAQDIMVYIDGSQREIVQIKLIDGDRVCVKTLDGSLKIFKLEDLHHIPKNF